MRPVQRFASYSIIGLLGFMYGGSMEISNAQNTLSNRDEIVLLLSGKRFAGKDYICKRIKHKLDEYSLSYVQFNHADQMKKIYCDSSGANLELMLKDRIYKERHRDEMTKMYQGIISKESNKFKFCESIYKQIVDMDENIDSIVN